MNEVRDVYSAPEILILQYIHGVDAITDIKKARKEPTNTREHKSLLKSKYDQALVKRDQSIDKIFGALGDLPNVLPDHILEENDIVDEDDVIAIAKSATKAEKRNNAPKNLTQQNNIDSFVPEDEVDLDDLME